MAGNIPIEVIVTAKDKASSVLSGIGSSITSTGSKFQGLEKNLLMGGAAMTAVGVAAVAMGKSFVDAAGYVEVQRTAMRTLIGDVEVAEKTYRDLVNFAAKTPFEIPQILEQSKRLLAMGTDAKDLTKVFGMLGDVASGVGMEKLPQLVLAFGQIQAKGRLMGTELRQLTEAGFNLADAMGISNEKLDQLVEDKAVKFEDVRKAFENVTKEGGRFHGMMGELAKTTPGQLSNLNDNLFKLRAALGDALLPAVNQLIQAMLPLIEKFSAWAQENPKIVQGILAVMLVVGAVGTALVTLGSIISGATAVWGALTAIAGVLGAVIGAISLPVLAIIAAIAALIAIGYLLITNWEAVKAKTIEVFTIITTAITTFVTNAIAWFGQLPTMISQFFYQLFVEYIPFAVGFAIGWLMVKIPELITNIIAWFQQLPGRILAILTQVKNTIVQKFTEIWNWISTTVPTWPGKIQAFLQSLPGLIKAILEQLYAAFLDRLNAAWGVVSGFKDKVVGAFNAIVEAVGRAIDAIKRGIEAGKAAASGGLRFQTGGIVPGPIGKPVPAMLHAGEEVIPVGKRQSGGGGGGMNITVNIGLYAGTETEKRNIAEELYAALARTAQASNLTVQEKFGA